MSPLEMLSFRNQIQYHPSDNNRIVKQKLLSTIRYWIQKKTNPIRMYENKQAK